MDKDLIIQLSAYIDGELDAPEQVAFELELENNDDLLAMYESMIRANAGLQPAYAGTLNAPAPKRLTSLLEEPQERGSLIVDFIHSWLKPKALVGGGIALVAGIVMGSMLGVKTAPQTQDLLITEDGRAMAGSALTNVLASARSGERLTASGEPVTIRLSLVDADGRYCREFQLRKVGGLACKDTGGEWVMEVIAARPEPPEHAMSLAGQPDDVVSAAIANLGEVTPLDTEGEKKAIAQDWK